MFRLKNKNGRLRRDCLPCGWENSGRYDRRKKGRRVFFKLKEEVVGRDVSKRHKIRVSQ